MQSLPTAGGKVPSAGFDQLYEEMSGWQGWSSPKVRENVLSSARNLFKWLRERGHESMSTVRLDDVRDHYMQRATEITYLHSVRYTLKLIFSYMAATGRIGFDSSSVLRLKVSRRNRILPAMDADAIAQCLGHGSVRSVEHYICLAGESLAECALGFDVIGNGGALWN